MQRKGNRMNVIRTDTEDREISFEEMYRNEKIRADELEHRCLQYGKEIDLIKKDYEELIECSKNETSGAELELQFLRGKIDGLITAIKLYWS